MTVEGLKRLKVWVKAKDFALQVYSKVLPLLPAEEKWNLTSQLRRSSLRDCFLSTRITLISRILTEKSFKKSVFARVIRQIRVQKRLKKHSLSISANIAEGYGRFYYQDNVRFCYIARGSLDETLSHLVFAFEVKYISSAIYQQFETEGGETDKMLNGYIAYLKKSKQGANEPGAATSVREDQADYFTQPSEDITL